MVKELVKAGFEGEDLVREIVRLTSVSEQEARERVELELGGSSQTKKT